MSEDKITFLDKLIYFGGNLGIRPPLKDYVDLEEFVTEATNHMQIDSRTTQTFFNWLHRYSPFLSPSKLRRILQGQEYNPKWLGQFLLIIENHPLNSQNWEILKPLCKKSTRFTFVLHQEKYLKTHAYILKFCPELKFRVEGYNHTLADLKAYLKKHKKFSSLYQIAKATFNPRNRINHEFKMQAYLRG